MKIMQENLTSQKFIELVNDGELSLEHPLQREAGLWSNQKRQKFVSTLVNGLYVPPFFIVQKSGSYLLDGLQRFTTIKDIITDNFIFVDDVKLFKNGMLYEIAGKKFSEIDKKLQDKILQFNFTMAYMTDATSREIEETFHNLNDGEQMSESVKAKSILGIETATWLNKIAKHSLFTDKINLTEKQKKNKDEQTILYQYTYIKTKGNDIEDLSQAAISLFLRENRDIFTKELRKEIENICEYITLSLPENNDKYKKITKTHIPMLMLLVKQAIEKNIDNKLFGEWIIHFFKDYNKSEYKNKGCGAGNVKKEKTLVRISEMGKHFEDYIKSTTPIVVTKEEPKQEEKKNVSQIENFNTYNDDNWEEPCRILPSGIMGAYQEARI